MKNKTLFKFIYIIYILGIIAFIFSNSLPSINESAETSGKVLSFINTVLEELKLPIMESDVFIRKAAHFAEFFVLGASICSYSLFDKKCDINYVIKALLLACLVAMTDETIQYFTGRGSMLLDVWLDLSGATTGIILASLVVKNKIAKKY